MNLKISIHALREEGDMAPPMSLHSVLTFLSTPSARRVTDLTLDIFQHIQISIHALREEGDFRSVWSSTKSKDLYPRPPRGGRH